MRRLFKLLPLLLLLSLFTGCAQKTNHLAEAYSVFSMKPKEFSQIEITNQQLQEQKIVDKTKDIRNILRTLKKAEQLPEVKPELSALSNTYAMKLFTAGSTMPFLTISYAENTEEACLFIGGDAYSVKPLDLDKLWKKQRDGVNAVIAVNQCDKPVLCAQHILRAFVVIQNVIGVDEIQCVKVVDAFILQLLNRCQL